MMTKTAQHKTEVKEKTGYKKTKLGWIPEEWEKIEFGDFAIRNSAKHNPQTENFSYPCIELEHIEQGTGKILGWTNSEEQASIKNRFNQNSILFGKLRPYLKKYWKSEFEGVCSSEIWVLEGKKNLCSNDYLFYLVQQHKFIEVCNRTSGSKMPRADWGLVSVEPFVLPPLPEQQKIAAILSKCDEQIAVQTQLIHAKEQQKKGLMQQLLTGEVRFDGFDEEWEEVKLGEVADIDKNSLKSNTDPEYTFQYVSLSDVNEGKVSSNLTVFKYSNAPSRARRIVKPNSVIMATVRPNLQAFAIINNHKDLIVSTGFAVIDHNEKLNPDYLFQYLFSKHITNQLESLIVGTNYPAVNSSDIRNLKLKLPSIKEQQKIASVLLAADNEIELLKKELRAMQEQKKGLMQVLLTGEVRVKVN